MISPDVASKLVISTPPSSSAMAAQAFVTQPVVYEEDQYGNLETGDSSSTVTASLATGTGPLQGTTTVTMQGGVAAFSGLYDPTAETITLEFTGGTLVSPASNAIVVAPGAAVKMSIVIGPYANVVAGNPLTDPIVIDEVDADGNIVTSDNSTQVTATLATGNGTLYGTTSVTVHGGVATFNDLEDDTAGTLTLAVRGRHSARRWSRRRAPSTPAPATKLVVSGRPAASSRATRSQGSKSMPRTPTATWTRRTTSR